MVRQHVLVTPSLSDYETVFGQWVDYLYREHLYDTDFVVDEVSRWCRVQATRLAVLRAAAMLEQGRDPEHVVTVFDQLSTTIAESGGLEIFDPFEITQNSLYERLFVQPARDVVQSPWAGLNHQIGGGYGKKELTVFAAPTGSGKSWVLAAQGVHAARLGKFVLHVTLEMSTELTMHRYLSILTGMSISSLADNPEALWTSMDACRQLNGRFICVEQPPETLKLSTLKDFITQVSIQYNRMPDMVIVDYADLMRSESTNSRSEETNVVRHALSSLYTGLRAIAVAKNLAMLTASQTNRASLGREIITIADLSEAFAKAFIADLVIALCQTNEEYDENRMRAFLAKVRNSRRGGEVGLRINFDRGEIIESGVSPEPANLGGGGAAAAAGYMQNMTPAAFGAAGSPPPPVFSVPQAP